MAWGVLLIGCNTESNDMPFLIIPQERIYFISNQDTGTERMEIYYMNTNGYNVTRVTNTDTNHAIFGIDPSERYIVATRFTTDKLKRVWLLDMVTGDETALTDADNNAEGRTFSPDGEWIVFWMIPNGETFSDIYKIRRDGTSLTNLTNTPLAHELDPAQSKTGIKIAFNYNNGSPNRFILKTMDNNGSNVMEIYDPGSSVVSTPLFPPGVYDPSWSHDDEWILAEIPVKFTGDGENGHAGIWHIIKIRSDGSQIIDLSEAGGHSNRAEYLPSFSPDGNLIIFSGRYGPVNPSQISINIFTMDKDGGSLTNLTDSAFWEQFPIWTQQCILLNFTLTNQLCQGRS